MYVKPGQTVNLFTDYDAGDTTQSPALSWKSNSSSVQLAEDGRSFNRATISDVGTHTVEVQATTGTYVAKSEVTVMVINENLPPQISLANEMSVVLSSNPIMLNASGTMDPNGDTLTHNWELVQQPQGSSLTSDSIQGRTFAYATNKIDDVQYYLFFAGCMFLTALLFIPYAMRYRGETYIQEGTSEKSSTTS